MKKILLAFTVLLILSCTNAPKAKFEELSKSKVEPLKIPVDKDNTILNLNETDFKFDVVHLDSNYLVGGVDKLIDINDALFILDVKTNSLFCFNKDGSKKWIYSKLGRGPGEHGRLLDFCIRDNFVYLFDEQLKQLKLDLNGQYVRQKQIPFKDNKLSPTSFFVDENQNIAVYSSDRGDKYDFPFKIAVLDSNLINIKSVFLRKKNAPGEKKWQNSQFPLQPFNDNSGFFYTEALNDTIYTYNEKENLERKYLVDFGKYKTPKFFIEKKEHSLDEFWSSNYGGNISSIFDTGSILTFKTYIDGAQYYHFVSKSTWKVKNYSGIQLKSGEYTFAVEFIGGIKNKLYFKVEPYNLVQGFDFYKNAKYKSLSLLEYSNKIKREMPIINTLLTGTTMNSNTILVSVELNSTNIFK